MEKQDGMISSGGVRNTCSKGMALPKEGRSERSEHSVYRGSAYGGELLPCETEVVTQQIIFIVLSKILLRDWKERRSDCSEPIVVFLTKR